MATIDHFSRVFAPCGFRREAFYPGCGLAEFTIYLCDRLPSEPLRELLPGHVDLGPPRFENVVRIVDPETSREVPPGTEGEIWVDGGSKALGYWAQPELSEQTFRARLASDPTHARTYLRTGDLGRLISGNLVISGRLKGAQRDGRWTCFAHHESVC